MFITGGYTCNIQILDMGVNKPFKNHIRDTYCTWLGENDYDIKPQRLDVAQWVMESSDASKV